MGNDNGSDEDDSDEDIMDPNPGLQKSLKHIADSVWNTRGWTYQESYVSRRLVVFHPYGVYFECPQTAAESLEMTEVSEALEADDEWWSGQGIPNGPRTRSLTQYFTVDLMSWLTYLITEYSQRNLTYQSDTIKAFSAIVQRFDGKLSVPFHNQDSDMEREYSYLMINEESSWGILIVQGVPFYTGKIDRSSVSSARLNAAGLCWHNGLYDDSEDESARKPDFPSWSWAGWTGPIKWELPQRGSRETIFHVENIGFVENLESKKELTVEEAKKSQRPLLCLGSIAFPPEMFLASDSKGRPNDRICLYDYVLSWLKEGYLCYSENSFGFLDSGSLRQELLWGLQQGTHKLVLLYVHHMKWNETMFQAWIVRRCETEELCYERVGSVFHRMESKSTFTKGLEKFIDDTEWLEDFTIC